jgi:hypothetical protein
LRKTGTEFCKTHKPGTAEEKLEEGGCKIAAGGEVLRFL